MIAGPPPAEIDVTPALVRALLDEQYPDLAHLPLTVVGSGWDNQVYRLGDALAVRLPRRTASAPLIEHEQRWLPVLAPGLPLATPVPVRIGRPGCGFPWSWSVTPWLRGTPALHLPPLDAVAAAIDLGAFLSALHGPAPGDAPVNPYRGVSLAARSETVHQRASELDGIVDRTAVLAAWERALAARVWDRPPVWIHGDLQPMNLLVDDARVSAVIDFGDLTAGDPATDLSVAWTLLPSPARPLLRESARASGQPIDRDTWIRARGWALLFGLVFLATSRDNEVVRRLGRRTIDAVLGD